ncbi:MAG TPA: 3-isopropylmalate dehydratase small subunit [Frankiaceae bacterium]|nr:3-isopropylmalate dehydratase small subunit [Frankiaceae bacterium]
MNPFTVHTGTALPLRRSDVDTDQIIPAVWLKRVERTGFGAGLFSAWRKDPAFVLNDARYAGATVLLAGENFGTGSSREHAVWALTDYGFAAVLSPRFADIFRGNSHKNGFLPVQLPEAVIERLMDAVEADPTTEITVDLERGEVRGAGITESFHVDSGVRHRLLNGLDDIALTLQSETDISSFEARRPTWLPATL